MTEANRFRFRAWDGCNAIMHKRFTGSGSTIMNRMPMLAAEDDGVLFAGQEYSDGTWNESPTDFHIMQSTGLIDCKGVELFDGDVVYIAGYGDYVCEFPYTELYEAAAECDIGHLKGNIHENPDLREAE